MARYPNKVGPADMEAELFDALNRFEQRFMQDQARGEPTRYEVRVDKLRVLGPTEDCEEFANVLDYVNLEKTTEVEVRVYRRNSRVNDQYVYLLAREAPPAPQRGLDGFDGRLDAEVERMRQKFAHEQLQRELEQMSKDYKELDAYTDTLETELENFREKRFYLGEVNLIDVGGMLLEGLIRRNHQVLGNLLGAPAAPSQWLGGGDHGHPGDVGEAGFERAQGGDDPDLEILRRIRLAFGEAQLADVLAILDHLSLEPASIPAVLSLLENGTRPNGNI